MKLVFATGNRGKLREAREILGPSFEIVTPADLDPEYVDPEENGTTFKENALIKAQAVWDKFHLPCFADDSGLQIDALGGRPGIYSARYAGEDKDFDCNIDKVLEELEGISQRSARFHTTVALILEDGTPHFFDGTLEGAIATERHGTLGFGYDPIFYPTAMPESTFGELGPEVKNQFSHREQALKEMTEFLSRTVLK
ncbi:MAG: RdgB/HAM1 family non-canonical purine NTP pyrophosphatase [Bacteroidales bacterium]|nr:RdgB/HAM1 family non-canonical purine NTP pyrophosphatase [Bacteroidales bacterium]